MALSRRLAEVVVVVVVAVVAVADATGVAAAPDASSLLTVEFAVGARRAFASLLALALAMASIALDALRPLLAAKRAVEEEDDDDNDGDGGDKEGVAGIREASADGEKASLAHPNNSRRGEIAGAAVADTSLMFLGMPSVAT